jgi:hypothetical protein
MTLPDHATMSTGVQNTEEEGHQQLDYYVKERGCNFIDTVRPVRIRGKIRMPRL